MQKTFFVSFVIVAGTLMVTSDYYFIYQHFYLTWVFPLNGNIHV